MKKPGAITKEGQVSVLIYPSATRFLHVDCGTVKAADGTNYELSLVNGNSLSVRRVEPPGPWYVLGFHQLMDAVVNLEKG